MDGRGNDQLVDSPTREHYTAFRMNEAAFHFQIRWNIGSRFTFCLKQITHTHTLSLFSQRKEECHPMGKLRHWLLQPIIVRIKHKLLPIWVQIQVRNRQRTLSETV